MVESLNCPHCGAPVGSRAVACWLCCRSLTDAEERPEAAFGETLPAIDRDRPGLRRRHRQPGGQFTLGSLMLVVTLVAVGLGIGVAIPCVGVVFAIFCVPAWIRTARLMRNYRTSRDAGATTVDKMLTFVESLVLAFLSAVVAVFGFIGIGSLLASMVGLLGFPGNLEGIIGVLGGGISALVIFVYFWREFWPQKRDDSPHPDSGVARRD